jgi:hypothetical protein
MKNILLGAVAFFLFSVSISILQTSCDNDAEANPEIKSEVTHLGKLIYYRAPSDIGPTNIYLVNYDGTGITKLNIIMPGGYNIDGDSGGPSISPDGKKIFFPGYKCTGYTCISYIFSCNIDGSNVTQLFEFRHDEEQSDLGGAY